MEKNDNVKKNITIRLSKQQLEFLSEVAIDYNCEPDKIQDVIRAIIVEQMRIRGFFEKKPSNN